MPNEDVTAERLAAAARLQTAMPDGAVRSPRRSWEDRVAGIWSVVVEDPRDRRGAWLRVCGDRVSVPAGMAHAARELRGMDPLAYPDWDGGLIYLVTAAGGTTPAYPDVWDTVEHTTRDGGVCITVRMTEREVAFALAGGAGQPGEGASAGGLAEPVAMTEATLEITSGYAMRWRYRLGDADHVGPAGTPASQPPALDEQVLIAVLQGARDRAQAPRAMPVDEPHTVDGLDGVFAVELFALGTVYVRVGDESTPGLPVLQSAGDASAEEIVKELSAAAALPYGLLPIDFGGARVADGELVADMAAPLVEWAAAKGGRACPRVPGAYAPEAMNRCGRVRLALDGSLDWTLEVDSGAVWTPAGGMVD
jgi:RecA/RadA recombinase